MSSTKLTLDTYSHVTPTMQDEVVRLLEETCSAKTRDHFVSNFLPAKHNGKGFQPRNPCRCWFLVVRPEGLEPPTRGLGNRCSILLSYGRTEIKKWRARRDSNPQPTDP